MNEIVIAIIIVGVIAVFGGAAYAYTAINKKKEEQKND